MWLGSSSSSWWSHMIGRHSVNRWFREVGINFPLNLWPGFHPSVFKKSTLILYNYLHVPVIRELKNIRAPHACPRTDVITGTKSWKNLPVSLSLQNYTLESFFLLKINELFHAFLFLVFWGIFFFWSLWSQSWNSVLWLGILYFYQQEAILRISNSAL